MDKKKVLAWVTYILNMLFAIPFIGLIVFAFSGISLTMAFYPNSPPDWTMIVFPILLDLLLIILWGTYQYKIIILRRPLTKKETIRNAAVLGGIVLFFFLLFFGTAIMRKKSMIRRTHEQLLRMHK